LRPIQVFGRIRYHLRRPRPDLRPAPELRPVRGSAPTVIFAPASLLAPDRFRLLGMEGTCSEASHWQGPGRPKLWTYNLHYFDDLNAADAVTRRAWHERLLERWIDENPPGRGVGWEPYPVSRRIVNWIKWSMRGNVLSDGARHSLAVQTRWLLGRIEWHLQGNHLVANAKALVYAGLYFQGTEAEMWLRGGLELVRAEISEQVLADGGHFERSPMYHAGFVEDLLDCAGILQTYGRKIDPSWPELIARMLHWLDSMSHPDGDIAFFNDAAFGVAPNAAALRDYGARLGINVEPLKRKDLRQLMPSGYVSIARPPFLLLCDVAPVGPEHLPAHAHADTLSFELSVEGRRIFVNSGTSEYGAGAERQRQRGTAAHNTLMIDDENSSEVWAGFRVARRARTRLLKADTSESSATVAAEHDGYRRLPGGNLHRRSWTLTDHDLVVADEIEGSFRSARAFFHVHPDFHVERGSDALQLRDARGISLEIAFRDAARVEVRDSTWHPQFGIAVPNQCIVAVLEGPRLKTLIRVSPRH
jgi:uncharacterized heparinase superfamily protein